MDLTLRPPRDSDIHFIRDSWLRMSAKTRFARSMDNSVYFPNHRRQIKSAMKRGATILAVNPEDDDQIYGYITFEDSGEFCVIHYIYLKEIYRGFGLSRQLTEICVPEARYLFHSHLSSPDERNEKHTKISKNSEGQEVKHFDLYSTYFERLTGSIYNPYLFLSDSNIEQWKESLNESTEIKSV